MKIKNLIDEDFINYKKPAMLIGFCHCSFKCDKECGKEVCQNSKLALLPTIEIETKEIVERYYKNPITEAVVFCGLEPFDDFNDIIDLISFFKFYQKISYIGKGYELPDIIIYTGYYPHEISGKINILKESFSDLNIIIKFGRFIPNRPIIYDKLLGINLASDNQFAEELKNL